MDNVTTASDIYHLIVGQTEQQVENLLWMDPGYYNESLLYYVFSNRFMAYIMIAAGIVIAYATYLLGYIGYQLYWCGMWEENGGKSRWSICELPEPGTRSGVGA